MLSFQIENYLQTNECKIAYVWVNEWLNFAWTNVAWNFVWTFFSYVEVQFGCFCRFYSTAIHGWITVIARNVEIPILAHSHTLIHIFSTRFIIQRKTSIVSISDEVDANFSCISIKYSIPFGVQHISVGDENMMNTYWYWGYCDPKKIQCLHAHTHTHTSLERSFNRHCFTILPLPLLYHSLSYTLTRARIHP